MSRKGGRKPSDTPIRRWFRTIRALHGLDQAELAQYIGKSRSAVAMYEQGDRPIPPEVVAAIREAFPDAPPPPELGEIQVKATAVSDNLLGVIKYAGIVPCSKDWGDPLAGTETRPISPKFAGKNRFLCTVAGDSCYPALQPTDLTVWEKTDAPAYGLIVIAQRHADSACTVKQLVYDNEAKRPRLVPVNPDHAAPSDDGGWDVTAMLVGAIYVTADGTEVELYWPKGTRPAQLVAIRT